jgi:hypothetical protein
MVECRSYNLGCQVAPDQPSLALLNYGHLPPSAYSMLKQGIFVE